MRFTRGEKIIIVILCVFAEILLACAIVWMLTSTHEIAVDHVAYADVYGASAPEAEAEEAEETITIYRDGDGEPPEWYKPDEEMIAEWYADESYLLNVPLDAEFQAYLYGLCREYDIPYTLAVAPAPRSSCVSSPSSCTQPSPRSRRSSAL